MVGLLRFWSSALGLGLLGVWLTDYMHSPVLGSWIAWTDGILALAAFGTAAAGHPSRRSLVRVGLPAALSAVLLVLGLIAVVTGESQQLIWSNFFFALAFLVLALASAFGGTGVVVRHPLSHLGDLPSPGVGQVVVKPARSPSPQLRLTTEEIEELYGPPEDLTGFEYQPRAGYSGPREGEHPNLFGLYWGVGPKGYLRSDVRIADEISEKLARRPDLDASGIEVDVRIGDVTLRGRVASRGARRIAEAICDSVVGVKDVHNELEVVERVA